MNHTPEPKKTGEWHIPFADQMMDEEWSLDDRIKVGVARSARLSYKNFEGEINLAKDLELFERLKQSGHWSPFEHVAAASNDQLERSGNFIGWIQYRKFFPDETRSVDVKQLLAERIAGGSKYACE